MLHATLDNMRQLTLSRDGFIISQKEMGKK